MALDRRLSFNIVTRVAECIGDNATRRLPWRVDSGDLTSMAEAQ